jgi:hypothetical protein
VSCVSPSYPPLNSHQGERSAEGTVVTVPGSGTWVPGVCASAVAVGVGVSCPSVPACAFVPFGWLVV